MSETNDANVVNDVNVSNDMNDANDVADTNDTNDTKDAADTNGVTDIADTSDAADTTDADDTNDSKAAKTLSDAEVEKVVDEALDVRVVPPKKRIVAVDDSNMVLKTLKNVLDNDKYELHAFSAGTRALEYLEKKDIIPDLIILDIEMPIMNGYELLKRIRKIVYLQRVPVVFLTSHNQRTQVVKAVSDGANDYVVKPIDKDILLKKIDSLVYNQIAPN